MDFINLEQYSFILFFFFYHSSLFVFHQILDTVY